MLNPDGIFAASDAAAAPGFAGPEGRTRRLGLASRLRMKRILDCSLAFTGLVVLAPLLLFCMVVVKCVSPGPAVFSQLRAGFQGRAFRIWKLRTMHPPAGWPANDDARRIFWFGGLLRRLSIDELPQLINVLRGEMSLVGPRPHMVGQMVQGVLFEDAVLQYARRHQMLPGMTGLAQICGCRGPAVTPAQIARRVAYDLDYVERWSLKLDMLILLHTLCFGFLGKTSF